MKIKQVLLLIHAVLLTGCGLEVVAEGVVAAAALTAETISGTSKLIEQERNHRTCENSLLFGSVEEPVIYLDSIPDDLSGEYCLLKKGRRGIDRSVTLHHLDDRIEVLFKDFKLEGTIQTDQINIEIAYFSQKSKGILKLTSKGNLVGEYDDSTSVKSPKFILIRRRPENSGSAGNEILGTTLFDDTRWVGVAERIHATGKYDEVCYEGNLNFHIENMKLKGNLFLGSSYVASIDADINSIGDIEGQVLNDEGMTGKFRGWLSIKESVKGYVEFQNFCEIDFMAIPK